MKIAWLKDKSSAFLEDDLGVTAIEYALLSALIFAVIVTAVTVLGTNLDALYNAVAAAIPTP